MRQLGKKKEKASLGISDKTRKPTKQQIKKPLVSPTQCNGKGSQANMHCDNDGQKKKSTKDSETVCF